MNFRILTVVTILFLFQFCKTVEQKNRSYNSEPSYSHNCSLEEQLLSSKIISAVNELRNRNGLRLLEEDYRLEQAARSHLKEIINSNKIFHSKKGRGLLERLSTTGIKREIVGENVARFKATTQLSNVLIESWKTSVRESKNIYNNRFEKTGISFAPSHNYCYVVMIFSN